MDLAVLPSAAERSSPDPQAALQQALDDFRSILTDQQRRKLSQIGAICDADTVFIFTSQLDHENRAVRPGIASRFYSVLRCVQTFSSVVETFVSSHPEIAALVWGSVKLTMLIAVNFTSYFEALSSLFMTVKNQCPLFAEYQALYPTSTRLQTALCDFHAAIIRCCKHVVEVLQQSWTQLLKRAIFQSFQDEMKADMESIRTKGADVKEEIFLAAARAQRDDEALQAKERKAASQVRSMLRKFIPSVEEDISGIKNMELQQSAQRSREERQRLLEWLSSHDHLTPFREACKKRQRGTADWIFTLPEFQSWHQGSAPPLLWCSGKIGSGKTILCSNLVNHIFRNKGREDQVSFFFVDRGDSESLEAETMIRSIIRQSIDPEAVPEYVYDRLWRLDRAIFVELDTWIGLLQEIARESKKIYIIIDGLDECEAIERQKVLHALSLLATTAINLRVFLSSRDSVYLDLAGGTLHIQRVCMSGDSLTADIRSYVQLSIQERLQRQEVAFGDTQLQEEVNNTLAKHADGMFLWVTFLIDEICAANCDDDIRQSLRRLPKNLGETFARALQRISSRQRHPDLVQKTFQWVAVAKRPLTLNELREAISIEIGQKSWRQERIPQNMSRIVLWSENLLHATEEEPIQVQFAHASIRDFITGAAVSPQLSKFHVDFAKAGHFAGEICMTYLYLSDFMQTIARQQRPIHVKPADIPAAVLSQKPKMARVSGLVTKLAFGGNRTIADPDLTSVIARRSRNDERELEALKSSHPFLKYAAKYWFPHTARFQEKKSATWELWLHMVSGGSSPAEIPWPKSLRHNKSKLVDWSVKRQHYALIRYACSDGPPHPSVEELMQRLAAVGDIEELALLLRARDWSSSCLNRTFQTACSYGHRKVAEFLLDFGADVNFESDHLEFQPALWAASSGGHVDMINWLLSAGADLMAEMAQHGIAAYNLERALQEASTGGHLAAVHRLLAAGAEVTTDTLYAASSSGHRNVVERLLAADVNVNGDTREDSERTDGSRGGNY